jgi:hypothetical protein
MKLFALYLLFIAFGTPLLPAQPPAGNFPGGPAGASGAGGRAAGGEAAALLRLKSSATRRPAKPILTAPENVPHAIPLTAI